MGSTILATVALLLLPNAPPGQTLVTDGVPELIVTLMPAVGVVPADGTEEAAPYRFQVSAMDLERRHGLGRAEVPVRTGQVKEADSVSREGRIHGLVNLRENGLATYKAELTVDGRTVARTSATIKVGAEKP
jgi:hypothetical protein